MRPVLGGQSRGIASVLIWGDLSPGQEIGNPSWKGRLRRQGSAEAIVPSPSRREGPNVEEGRNLSGSWDEHRRQTSPQGDLLGGWRW
jgi:hypothetical protein